MSRLERDRPDSLSVAEMLRIMDVATTLRLDRELIEEQLNVEQLKERLKERMLAASKVTGESVTPEEVDLAIRQYYAKLYTFREPKMSLSLAMAHAWVRRREILAQASVLLAACVLVWWLIFSPSAPLAASGRAHRKAGQIASEIARSADVLRAVSHDPKVPLEVARLTSEADTYRKRDDVKALDGIRGTLEDMKTKLGEEYAVVAVPQDTKAGRNRNTTVRYPPDSNGKETKAYYLFVQARKADGKAIPRRIHNSEIALDEDVTTWAEQIPAAVYERLAKDKREDGILNETAFAVKRKGQLEEVITMPGADGKPLARMGQITRWSQ